MERLSQTETKLIEQFRLLSPKDQQFFEEYLKGLEQAADCREKVPGKSQ